MSLNRCVLVISLLFSDHVSAFLVAVHVSHSRRVVPCSVPQRQVAPATLHQHGQALNLMCAHVGPPSTWTPAYTCIPVPSHTRSELESIRTQCARLGRLLQPATRTRTCCGHANRPGAGEFSRPTQGLARWGSLPCADTLLQKQGSLPNTTREAHSSAMSLVDKNLVIEGLKFHLAAHGFHSRPAVLWGKLLGQSKG